MRDFSFGNLLTSYRTRMGWTQQRVVEELEIALRTYQGWENGERLPPNTMLRRIANLFELNDTEADQLYRAAAQVAPELHNLPFPRNLFFTGRETYLEQLDHDLKESSAVAITQLISISGLGGIGKTQLALEYAHRCYPKLYRTVLWVNAESKVTLEESYLYLADLLNLPEQNEHEVDRKVQAVKTWLGGHAGWLLILDNADDLQLARTFLPAKHRGHVLLTTRSQFVGNIASPIILEEMEPEEGQRFLLLRSGLLKPGMGSAALDTTIHEAAAQLVELLGGHPLALDQAGAYIEATGTSINSYIQLFHEQRRILLDKRGSLGHEHPETVVVAFEVSFQRACEVCPVATDVLSFCAFLHPDGIPEELLSHDERLKLHPMAFDEAIGALRHYSLIKRNAQDKLLSLHRLVQVVLKDKMDLATQRQWAERAVLVVNWSFPDVEFETWDQCERCLLHALACAELIREYNIEFQEAGRLLTKAGWYLKERAQYAQAESLLKQGLAILEKTLGPEHRDVAKSLNELGRLYTIQNQFLEAESLLKQGLAIRKKTLGPEHRDVAYSLNNLAMLYIEQGKYKQAERLYKRALAIRKQSLGAEHPEVAQSLNNLAGLYYKQDNFVEAEPLYQDALDIYQQTLGVEHPEVADILNTLANLYVSQRRYEQAELLYQRALDIAERTRGPEHPSTKIIRENYDALLWGIEKKGKGKGQ